MKRKQIQSLSIIVLLALMIVLLGRILLPYMSVLLWSAICYILISPLHQRIVRRLKPTKRLYEAKRHLLAGVFAVGTILIVAGVLLFLGFQLIGRGRLFLEEASTFVSDNPYYFQRSELGVQIADVVKQVSMGTIDISSLDIKTEVLGFLTSYAENVGALARGVAKNVGNFVLSLVFMCFTLYFFYLDATYLANLFIRAIPIDQKNTRRLLSKFRDVTTNLFMGFFLVALYQATAAFIIFSIFQVRGALLFSVLLLFSSFVPMLGCALIWLPLGVGVIVSKGLTAGVVFMVLCAVFISFLDNFLRPLFLKDRIKIHPLLIFFSILGGLKAFGFNGIILGPVVVILFFTIMDIALEEESGTVVELPREAPAAFEGDDGGE